VKSLKYLLLPVIAVLTAFKSTEKIKFLQGDKVYEISAGAIDSITIDRKPFSIRYFSKRYDGDNNKFYSAKIAVLDRAPDPDSLKIGTSANDIPFFEPGTGMAPGANEMYDTMFVNNEGHHYLTYESDTAKRVYLVLEEKGDLELEWKISAVNYQGTSAPLSELKLDHVYFVIFIDRNLNQKVDPGELTIVKVKMK